MDEGAREKKEGTDQEILVGRIAQFAGGLTLVVAGAAVVCWLFYGAIRRRLGAEDPPPSPIAGAWESSPEGPRLQRSPPLDMARLRAHEDAILGSYGWGDQEAATARIPIERAMELMAERGLRPALSERAPEAGEDGRDPLGGEPELGTGDMGLGDEGILDVGSRARGREGGGE